LTSTTSRGQAREGIPGQSEIIITKAPEFSEIEQTSMKKISANQNVPQKPFGLRHQKWLNFKTTFQSGDCLVHFVTPEKAWIRLSGLEGYAIIRSDTVISVFVLKVS
jgi:hypothetical protein